MEEGYCTQCGGFMIYLFTEEGNDIIHWHLCQCCNNYVGSGYLVFNEEEYNETN